MAVRVIRTGPNSMWNKPGDYPEEMQGLGLATIREDGYVSMDADASPGSLTTLPLRFDGRHLMVNADARGGSVAVELLDVAGRPIPGYTQAECVALTADALVRKFGGERDGTSRPSWEGRCECGLSHVLRRSIRSP